MGEYRMCMNHYENEYTMYEEELMTKLHDLECKIISLENENETLREIIYNSDIEWSVEL